MKRYIRFTHKDSFLYDIPLAAARFKNFALDNDIEYEEIEKEYKNLTNNDGSLWAKDHPYKVKVFELNDVDVNLLLLTFPDTVRGTYTDINISIYEIVDDKLIKKLR